MKILASIDVAGMRSSRRPALRRISAHNNAIPLRRTARGGLLLTLIGLSALLLIPFLARQQAEHCRERVEVEIEPARERIDRTLLLAYETRSDMLLPSLLPADVPTWHLNRSRPTANDFVDRWNTALDDDRAVRACGGGTWRNWLTGKRLLNQWVHVSMHANAASAPPSLAVRNQGDRLFTQGIQALKAAKEEALTAQKAVRSRVRAIGHIEIILTVPMVLLCLLLAFAAWKTQLRLRHFWRRERATTRQLTEANYRLEMLATTDGLTGLKNHRAFQEWLEGAFRLTVRHDRPLSLLLLDVDRFKQVNDTHGHPAGDEILKQVASIFAATCRASDTPARYGGEEFAVILPNTDQIGAMRLAERFRARIADEPWSLTTITVSIGVATLTRNTCSQAQLIAESDAALYVSKQTGRNRVTHYEEAFIDWSRQHVPHAADTNHDKAVCFDVPTGSW